MPGTLQAQNNNPGGNKDAMLKLQRVEKDIGCGEEGVGPE